jgi:peptidoglycan hydrolase CwlO-like protein
VHLIREEAIEQKLDQVLAAVNGLQAQGVTVMKELDDLTTQVAQNTSVEESAVQTLNGLAQQIADLKNDPAKLQALSDSLKASATDLAAAIAANTPAAPPSS